MDEQCAYSGIYAQARAEDRRRSASVLQRAFAKDRGEAWEEDGRMGRDSSSRSPEERRGSILARPQVAGGRRAARISGDPLGGLLSGSHGARIQTLFRGSRFGRCRSFERRTKGSHSGGRDRDVGRVREPGKRGLAYMAARGGGGRAAVVRSRRERRGVDVPAFGGDERGARSSGTDASFQLCSDARADR